MSKIPQRYILAFMGFLALINAYTMRISLSVAITQMVPPISKNTTNFECTPENDTISPNVIKNPKDLYDWDEDTQGLILSSFYWGYIVTHLPGGVLAEKFGGKHLLGLGMLSTAIFTIVTPLVIHLTHGNWVVLVVLRMIEGLGEGVTYPALTALLAKWIPLGERAKMGSLVYAGGQMGTIVSNIVSGALISKTGNWESVFYFFGCIGVLWFVAWTFLCYSEPNSNPFITDEERLFLEREIGGCKERRSVPWRVILTSTPLWALTAAQIGHDWGFYTMVTDLPKYMSNVLKFNVTENGFWSSIPYLFMWLVSLISGWLCDYLILKNIFSITFARKFFTTIASLGPAFFIVAASYSGCNRILAVWMFTIGMGFMGTFYCGMKVNALDLSPNFAGTIMAITNGIGSLTGVITPYLTGELTEDHSIYHWRIVFWITFAVFLVTNCIFVLFGSGEEQWWNKTLEKTGKSKKGIIS